MMVFFTLTMSIATSIGRLQSSTLRDSDEKAAEHLKNNLIPFIEEL